MPWGQYVNKVPKDAFSGANPKLSFANDYTLSVKPRALGGGFGWYGNKPNQVVNVEVNGELIKAQVMTSVSAHATGCSLSRDEFLAAAKPLPERIVSDLLKEAQVRTFSTGSFGWHAHTETAVKVAVGLVHVMAVINFQAVLKGTKPEGTEDSDHEAGDEVPEAKAAIAVLKTGAIGKYYSDGQRDWFDCSVVGPTPGCDIGDIDILLSKTGVKKTIPKEKVASHFKLIEPEEQKGGEPDEKRARMA